MKKLMLLVGVGVGYVLGTRAGRQRYDQMMGKAQQMMRNPRVQQKAEQVRHVAEEKADQVQHVVQEKTQQVTNAAQEKTQQAQHAVEEKTGQASQAVKEKVASSTSSNGGSSTKPGGTI